MAYYEVSAKEGTNITKMFLDLAKNLFKNREKQVKISKVNSVTNKAISKFKFRKKLNK